MPQKAAKPCPHARYCGGCQHINMPYQRQLARKQAYIQQLFAEAAGPDCVIEPIAGMEEPFGFRNKIISPFAPGKKLAAKETGKGKRSRPGQAPREVLHGMYAQGSKRIVALDSCPVEHPSGRRIVAAVAALMRKYNIPAYNIDTGSGFMRNVVVRVGHESGEVLVTLVTNGSEFTGAKNFCRELLKRCPEVNTVVQNVNTRQTNVILGPESRVLYGPGFILDTLCGLSFRISPQSFYQVNAVQTEVLYRTAVDWALQGAAGNKSLRIIDAYCGTGTIGLVAASMVGNASVVGVDKVEQGIADARQNAAHNGIENASFACADAGQYLRGCAARGERFDVLLMDPPRAGSSEEFLQAAAEAKIARIVYISCNPLSQLRDVAFLQRFGYKLLRLRPVDMFPHTEHIENVVLLAKEDMPK